MFASQCPRCRGRVRRSQNYCPRCGLPLVRLAAEDAVEEAEDQERPWYASAPTISYAGQLLASAMSGAVTALLALVLAFFLFGADRDPRVVLVTPAELETAGAAGEINASALVPIADSRFLVVDDLTDDAFYELTFTAEGEKSGPLVRRPVVGLSPGLVEDLEGATLVEVGGRRLIVAVSSLEKNEGERTEDGLVRVVVDPQGAMQGEVMPGFRNWLVTTFPEVVDTPVGPDALDVQGLIWDQERGALLLGVRSPSRSGKPLLLGLRVRDWNAPWTVENLERVEVITLDIGTEKSPRGVYSMTRHPNRREFIVIVGATGKHSNFELYSWDGMAAGSLRRIENVAFDSKMKPEGIAFGTIAERLAVVIVDDNGGYYVLWDDEWHV
jgi:hypothetical protein